MLLVGGFQEAWFLISLPWTIWKQFLQRHVCSREASHSVISGTFDVQFSSTSPSPSEPVMCNFLRFLNKYGDVERTPSSYLLAATESLQPRHALGAPSRTCAR